MTRKAADLLDSNELSSKQGTTKPKYGSLYQNVDFDPMLQVSIATGEIVIDRRRDKYWTTL